MVATISELYDLKLPSKELSGSYSKKVNEFREKLKFTYRKTSPNLTSVKFKYIYASRGDSKIVGESIKSRSQQIINITERAFTESSTSFDFVGSKELITLSRKPIKFSLELPIIEGLSRGERYIVLSKIKDFYQFLTDDKGRLRKYLFDSNVRAYMGQNRVNIDIKETLMNQNSPDFWWLNNGVTILATSAKIIGDIISIDDIQIVNGLQTSESIFQYFNQGNLDENDRAVLVKIIVTKEPDVRDNIIKATNNQTPVEIAALHATDKIQMDIEQALLREGYYYERRTNYYINQGIKKQLVIHPLYIASGFLSLILKSPHLAASLKNKFVRDEDQYRKIFNENIELALWAKIVKILKETDKNLDRMRSNKGSIENFLKRWRHLTSFLVLSVVIKNFNFTISDLIRLDISSLTSQLFDDVWQLILEIEPDFIRSKHWKNKVFFIKVIYSAKNKYDISGLEIVKQRKVKFEEKPKVRVIATEFIESVFNLLPSQPWRPGVHIEIMKQLKCSKSDFFRATKILIRQGRIYRQKDGILYDQNNQIVMIDTERVDPDTLKLREVE